MDTKFSTISVIGDGGWGTTLAIHLARNHHNVTLWGPFPEQIKKIKRTRYNTKFLPGIKIPKSIRVIDDLTEAITPADLIILATPSQYLEGILKKLRKYPLHEKTVLSVVKGIDTKTGERMSEIIHRYLHGIHFAVLSGPTIAREVAAQIPSTAVIASYNEEISRSLQHLFTSRYFRIYTNTDIPGVELGGSIKNIIAISCGVCDGLKLGTNTKAAILSRGLAEMARLGVARGAKIRTFAGLSGLGDLVTTCFSPNSRNRFVGEQLGKGKNIKEIMQKMSMVAEGVTTAKAVYKLSKKLNISMPITSEVYKIIYRNKTPHNAVSDLMSRKTKAEY